MGTGYILIANYKGDSVSYVARSNMESRPAGVVIKKILDKVDGKGGGSPTFAQGGSKECKDLDKILSTFEDTYE